MCFCVSFCQWFSCEAERLYRDVGAYAIPGGSEEILLDLAIRQARPKKSKSQRDSHACCVARATSPSSESVGLVA